MLCVKDENGCLSWSAPKSCGAGMTCDAQSDRCAEGCADECPQEGASKCDGVRILTCKKSEYSQCNEWSAPESCGPNAHCDAAADACAEGCKDECQIGDFECIGSEYRLCGQFDEDECLEYGERNECETDTMCNPQTKQCEIAECETDCVAGETTCSSDNAAVLVCIAQETGKCNVFAVQTECAPEKLCAADGDGAACTAKQPGADAVCEAGETRCSAAATALETCIADAGGNHWDAVPCNANEICANGVCGATCADACAEGSKQCSAKGLPQICVKSSSGCNEWKNQEKCGAAQGCVGGSCQYYCGSDCDPWSLVILPDTQNYTRESASETTYHKQMNWIVKNKDTALIPNLKMVLHMGDITNDNTDAQWKIAKSAHKILKDAKIPFAVVNGNHDYKVRGAVGGRSKSKFANYFDENYFKGIPGYKGMYASHNTYFNFTAGNQEYLVLNLEYYPRQQTICWANDLLRNPENANKKFIIATHANLSRESNYSGHSNVIDVANGAKGSELWSYLTSRHSNMIMALSGHVGGSKLKTSKGINGNIVEEILTDYQFDLPCSESKLSGCSSHCANQVGGGNGWLRILTFYPKENRVKVTTKSVLSGNKSHFSKEGKDQLFCSSLNKSGKNYYDKDPNNKQHQFEFTFDFTTPGSNVYNDKGNLAFARRTVNSNGTGQQINPSVASFPGGGFAVAWEDDSSDADGKASDGKSAAHDIYARILKPGGCNVSGNAEIIVNAGETQGHQSDPDIAADKDGNFVVVWTDDMDNNGSTQVFMRGFDANGKPRYARKTVNQVSTRDQYQPRIAMSPDGKFAVSWTDTRSAKTTPQIWVRGFNADGSQAFAERPVAEATEGTRVKSDIYMDEKGRFIVAWEDDADANGSTQAKFRMFNADGSYRTGIKTANTKSAGNQNGPSIAGTPDGSKFIISWTNIASSGASDYTVMARVFGENGNELKADFAASSEGGKNQNSQVCMNASGDAIIAWYEPAKKNVMLRKLSKDALSSAPQRVNQPDNSTQQGGKSYQPAVACIPGSQYAVVAYSDDADNNGYYEIYATGLEI